MKKHTAAILFIALLFLSVPTMIWSQDSQSPDSMSYNRIAGAVEKQLELHPYSQYRDVYKNFMQDYFGPGHILSDTVAAANYLRNELTIEDEFGGPAYEPTGYEGNFYRVNISLIRDGIIPFDVFFNAFVSSAQKVVPPSPDVWKRKWAEIDSVITKSGVRFNNEEEDRLEIRDGISEGKFVFHHTKQFNDSSKYHYRIISRDIFYEKILPFISERK